MKARTSIAAIGTAIALGGTGAFLLPAAASPRVVTHTLKVISVRKDSASFSKTSSGQADLDVNHAGKTVGYDMLHFTFNPTTRQASGGVTLDTAGGFLYGVLRITNNPVIHGRVTGGTGAFRGATGTITAKPLNKAGTRTAVTITYHR
jgi:hypothetical protein